MTLPDIDSDLEKIIKDPEKRAKLFFLWTCTLIAIPILIAIGTILFILIKLGIL